MLKTSATCPDGCWVGSYEAIAEAESSTRMPSTCAGGGGGGCRVDLCMPVLFFVPFFWAVAFITVGALQPV